MLVFLSPDQTSPYFKAMDVVNSAENVSPGMWGHGRKAQQPSVCSHGSSFKVCVRVCVHAQVYMCL